MREASASLPVNLDAAELEGELMFSRELILFTKYCAWRKLCRSPLSAGAVAVALSVPNVVAAVTWDANMGHVAAVTPSELAKAPSSQEPGVPEGGGVTQKVVIAAHAQIDGRAALVGHILVDKQD